ncbi:hypothetical protein ACFRI7_11630 [Streptomyces sp. NPDC056716]|uniref:hypothetical protein n=1 Tax=Streptomyces sp. NPDC056716 TaxID=3345922 RepID=UPI0036C72AB9
MPLHAAQFFSEVLPHRFDGTVVGNAFYAEAPDRGLRLRIEFYETIQADVYGGLRLSLIHPERGKRDVVTLSFADHGTFSARDQRTGTRPGFSGYATIRDYSRDTEHRPWAGGDFTTLADAVHRYARLWGIPTPQPISPTLRRSTTPASAPSRPRAAARTPR